MTLRHRIRPCLLGLALLPSCGVGTLLGLDAASQDSLPNNDPLVTELRVTNALVSPATVEFTLVDPEGDDVRLRLEYQMPETGGFEAMSLIDEANPTALASSSSGVAYSREWDFLADLEDGSLHENVTVRAVLLDRDDNVVLQGSTEPTPPMFIGNASPAVLSVTPPPGEESSGITLVRFEIQDDNNDPASTQDEQFVAVRAEFCVGQDCEDWQRATPAGVPEEDPCADEEGALCPTFEGLAAPRAGAPIEFFWDVERDLPAQEVPVRVRLLIDDGLSGFMEPGDATVAAFFVDNNAGPITFLGQDEVVVNSDQRRAIPVPFTVVDAESDPVHYVIQWAREGESFKSLADESGVLSAQRLEDLATGVEDRRSFQIATERPLAFEGRVAKLPAGEFDPLRQVRLPELASSAAGLLVREMGGLVLDMLRRSPVPEAVQVANETELVRPVDVIALGEGIDAIVLDAPAGGPYALRKVALATGLPADGPPTEGSPDSFFGTTHAGNPLALAIDRGERVLYVASQDDVAGTWKVARFDAQTGEDLGIHVGDIPAPAPGIVGLAAVSTNVALAAVGSSLLQIVFAPDGTTSSTVRVAGGGPFRGVVADPFQPSRVFLSVTDADRIVEVNLDSLELSTLPLDGTLVELGQVAGIDEPRDLAIDPTGSRLLVVARSPLGQVPPPALLEIGLGSSVAIDPEQNASKIVAKQITVLADASASVSAGANSTLIVAQPNAGDPLLVGGGIEQRRTLAQGVQSDPDLRERQVVTVTSDFTPPPESNSRWRILRRLLVSKSAPDGADNVFLWDAGVDLPKGGNVNLRIVPADTDVGTLDVGSGSKEILPGLGFRTDDDLVMVPAANPATDIAAADLEGDGDVDLVAAIKCGDRLTVARKEGPGEYARFDLTDGLERPHAVAIGDLDCDGNLDVLCGEAGSPKTESLFFFAGPISPSATKALLGPPLSVADEIESIALGDLDGDGQLDVAHTNSFSGTHARILVSTGCQPGNPSFSEVLLRDEVTTVVGGQPQTEHLDVVHLPSSLGIGDFDADGDLDLALASRGLGPQQGTGVIANDKERGNVLLFFQRGPAQFELDPMTSVLTAGNMAEGPRGVAAADLNRDGFTDLVTANARSRNVSVLLQNAQAPGSFENAGFLQDVETVDPPLDICAADVDGNGELDIVTVNGDAVFDPAGNVTIYNQVGGDFVPDPLRLRNAEALERALAIAALDVDGDGDVDLATANGLANTPAGGCKTGGALLIYPNTGPGTFALDAGSPFGQLGELAAVMRSLVAADLDGDGDVDLASSNMGVTVQGDANQFRPANLSLYRQLSPSVLEVDASFVEATTALGLAQPRGMIAVDATNDGLADLVFADRMADELVVLAQRGDGSFGFAENQITRLGGSGVTVAPEAVAAGDFNGDALLDLASVNLGSEDVTVFLADDAGGFAGSAIRLHDPAKTNSVATIAAGDLDGDGVPDLVAGKADFRFVDQTQAWEPFFHCAGSAPFDETIDAPVYFLSTGSGSGANLFESGVQLPDGGLEYGLRADALHLADLNADGYLDVGVAGQDGLTLLTQTGSLDFTVSDTFTVQVFQTVHNECVGTLSLSSGDLDGDGDVDLVADNLDTIRAYHQVGPGVFDPIGAVLADSNELQAVEFIQSVLVADVDGDGEVDVANTNGGSNTHTVNVFFNGH